MLTYYTQYADPAAAPTILAAHPAATLAPPAPAGPQPPDPGPPQAMSTLLDTSAVFPAEGESIAAVRRFVAETLQQHGIPATRVANACLLVSELATNAVRHAHSKISVRMHWTGGAIRVEVGDSSPRPAAIVEVPPEYSGGRGLKIVDSLSLTWKSVPSEHGKIVWFEI